MARTGESNLGGAPILTHLLVSFIPGRQAIFGPIPMHNGCLVTPVEKVWHRGTVRTIGHELSHAVLAIPGRHGPKSPTAIGQDRPSFEAGCLLDLSKRTKRVHDKRRQKASRPYPEPSYADERHRSFIGWPRPPVNGVRFLLTRYPEIPMVPHGTLNVIQSLV
jgi:hypothetical protein